MTKKTYDSDDPRDLPYRFAHSPITNEVFIIWMAHGMIVSEAFKNREAFHRFIFEGDKTDRLIAEEFPNTDGLKEAEKILETKDELITNN